MRSLFTDFGYTNGYLDEVVEAQLAHVWGTLSRKRQREEGERRMGADEVRKAYLRSPFWPHRVTLLQHWADVCTALQKGNTLRKIRAGNVGPPFVQRHSGK